MYYFGYMNNFIEFFIKLNFNKMPIILIEFCLSNVSASHYYIEEHSQELYEYLLDKIEDKFGDSSWSFRIIEIKIIRDLKPYRQVFGFKGNSFSTLWDNDISDPIMCQFLTDKNTALISEIFEIYNTVDPDFSVRYREAYLKNLTIHGTIGELQKFNDLLSQWLNYLQYRMYLINFRPINEWDCNLNSILDMYLNPEPYRKIDGEYYFICDNLESNIFLSEIAIRASLNSLDDNSVKKYNSQLLKFINDYNTDKIYL